MEDSSWNGNAQALGVSAWRMRRVRPEDSVCVGRVMCLNPKRVAVGDVFRERPGKVRLER